MAECEHCGANLKCCWATCTNDADVVLHGMRPCGHYNIMMNSCMECAIRTLTGGFDGVTRAPRPSVCSTCKETNHVEIHFGRSLTGGEDVQLYEEGS